MQLRLNGQSVQTHVESANQAKVTIPAGTPPDVYPLEPRNPDSGPGSPGGPGTPVGPGEPGTPGGPLPGAPHPVTVTELAILGFAPAQAVPGQDSVRIYGVGFADASITVRFDRPPASLNPSDPRREIVVSAGGVQQDAQGQYVLVQVPREAVRGNQNLRVEAVRSGSPQQEAQRSFSLGIQPRFENLSPSQGFPNATVNLQGVGCWPVLPVRFSERTAAAAGVKMTSPTQLEVNLKDAFRPALKAETTFDVRLGDSPESHPFRTLQASQVTINSSSRYTFNSSGSVPSETSAAKDPVTLTLNVRDDYGQPANGNYYLRAERAQEGYIRQIAPVAGNWGLVGRTAIRVENGSAVVAYQGPYVWYDRGKNQCNGTPCEALSNRFMVTQCFSCNVLGSDEAIEDSRIFWTWIQSWSISGPIRITAQGGQTGATISNITDSAGRAVPDGTLIRRHQGPYWGSIFSYVNGQKEFTSYRTQGGSVSLVYEAPDQGCHWPSAEAESHVIFGETHDSWPTPQSRLYIYLLPRDCP